MRRNYLKLLTFGIISSLLFPFNYVIATTKKMINKNLTSQQKDIMFNASIMHSFSPESERARF